MTIDDRVDLVGGLGVKLGPYPFMPSPTFAHSSNSAQRLDCLADDAVSCELVSAPNSLL